MRRTAFLLILCMRICVVSCAQEYNYVHYDTKDGLAGSTVYDITQDQDGFLWFATESGVSRYDGSHFRNFTTADGLPETEVLRVFADKQGRVWIAPFKNDISFFYQGKLHTKDNDSLLRQIDLRACVTSIIQDKYGNIALRSGDFRSFIIPSDARSGVYNLDYLPELAIDGLVSDESRFTLRSQFREKNNRVLNSYFILAEKQPIKVGSIIEPSERTSILWHDSILKTITPPPYYSEAKFVYPDMYFWNTADGCWLTNGMDASTLQEIFLKGKQITSTFVDNENNYWFGTMGEGIYKLASRGFKTYSLDKRSNEIFALAWLNNEVLAGGVFGKLYRVSGKDVSAEDYTVHISPSSNPSRNNRLTCIYPISSNAYILGFDGFLCRKSAAGKIINYDISTVKSIDQCGPDKILVATNRTVVLANNNDLSIIDTIWQARATDVCFYNNSYFVGTTEGLYIVDKNKSTHYAGEHFKPLRYRVGAFTRSVDGNLWIATYGGGIVAMKGNEVIAHLTSANGLTSDACRTLYIQGHTLWVGTDRGINKIDLSNAAYPVLRYNVSDGLPSNLINAIITDSNKVYVASPAGITVFDETKIARSSVCNLKVLDISVSDLPQPLTNSYHLHHRDNNFKIEFTAISFKSGGDIWYRYRLKGLTDNWDSTRQNLLAWPSLPSGDYELQIVAVNKFGVVSKPVNITFSIDTPFWKTAWFSLLVIAAIIAATSFLITRRFKALRKREQERAAVLQKVSNLEQLALRAQMNPHFIFNCLNSIQNFIISRDLKATNEYLTGFADLIRQTLHNSEKGTLSLHNEIRYLERYLELEKMRFGNSFSYSIEVNGELDLDATSIPPMILQPYVENSIRHGVRYIQNGHITVRFSMDADGLRCMVEDNGIGRKKAMEYRSINMHVEYQSKGMSLTADRIDALNRQFMESVIISITDLFNENNLPAGTRIVIHFPWSILTKFELHDEDRYHRR